MRRVPRGNLGRDGTRRVPPQESEEGGLKKEGVEEGGDG